MKRLATFLLIAWALALLTPPAFAAEGGASGATNWVLITPGFAMAIASGLCGYAQAKATASACESIARNPGATAAIRFALILALVLIESMALYTFALIYLRVK
ncbi:MAG TPA: ATP synthase F0 subunit C [Candidatus Acidoferrales bacterium]|nr:ATP synthase F0 subunit C [Candidatus Acidoferrales bacterium]